MTSPSTLPCLPPDLLASTLKRIEASDLARPSPQGRIIGYLIDHTPDYPDLVPHMNVEMAEQFPLLYSALSAALFALKRQPIYPKKLSLPAILLDGPASVRLPVTYLDLSSGHLTFSPPSGVCLQFHIHKKGASDAIFS